MKVQNIKFHKFLYKDKAEAFQKIIPSSMHLLLYFINNYYLNFQLLILDWKKIANKIGKFVKKAFEFLNCVFPQISGLVGCGKDIAKSSASCLKGKSNCHISFGGSNSKCMQLRLTRTYRKTYGKGFYTINYYNIQSLGDEI